MTELDVTGYSRGYTVTDAQGRVWDVKIGAEAQPEVVASRVLWLIGYHQPIIYFVSDVAPEAATLVRSRRRDSGSSRITSRVGSGRGPTTRSSARAS